MSAASSSPQQPPGAFCMSGGTMDPAEFYPEDLVYAHQASAATGVPETVIRKWASRGTVNRFKGDPSKYSGQGHEYKTMYALPEIKAAAKGYRPRQAAKAA